jgi:hypothetical protein
MDNPGNPGVIPPNFEPIVSTGSAAAAHTKW